MAKRRNAAIRATRRRRARPDGTIACSATWESAEARSTASCAAHESGVIRKACARS